MHMRLVRVATMTVTAMALCGAAPATQPGGESLDGYEVHDMKRQKQPVITPGAPATADQPAGAPSDAVVLFDGKDLSKWKARKGGSEAGWKVVDGGAFEVTRGKGEIATKDEFADVQLHVEWLEPDNGNATSQGRGNSGIFLMGMYEIQVLDSYQNETYPDGMAGSVYGQYPPLVNPARKPGEWQTYDVIFRAPKYEGGKMTKPARVTLLFNGVLVQDNVELLGPTAHKALASYPSNHPTKGPITLQDHGNPVRFRNIWLRELKPEQPKPPIKPAGAGH